MRFSGGAETRVRVAFHQERKITTNGKVFGTGEFELDGQTSTGSLVAVTDSDSTCFRFFGFLSSGSVASSSRRRRFFFLLFLFSSTFSSSSLPTVAGPALGVRAADSWPRAGWKPSIGAASIPSSVGFSGFALSLLRRFSKSRFCFHAIPFGSFACCAPMPSISSL